MLSGNILDVIILCVVMLDVIMLSVFASNRTTQFYAFENVCETGPRYWRDQNESI
jgi:hypothetical protein